ncbi:MAG TPA: HEAT repeat domain-containing protein [Bryobacteraceae bacterium]
MSLTQILEVVRRECGSGDEALEAGLRESLAAFNSRRAEAMSSMRGLQSRDPAGFVLAAARWLTSPDFEKTEATEYLTGLITTGNSLADPLLDENLVPFPVALAMAREISAMEPLFEARLMRKMLENAGGDPAAVPTGIALRVLKMIDAISDCSHITVYLMQLERHLSPEVRSKAALLLRRGNVNLRRVRNLLVSEDDRLRANAVESLWGLNTPQSRGILRDAASDPHRRVAINALIGLCKAGESDARYRLIELSAKGDPVSRRAAVWAMGQTGDPEFVPTLEALMRDTDERISGMAARSLARLRLAPSPLAAAAPTPATPETSLEGDVSTAETASRRNVRVPVPR